MFKIFILKMNLPCEILCGRRRHVVLLRLSGRHRKGGLYLSRADCGMEINVIAITLSLEHNTSNPYEYTIYLKMLKLIFMD